MLSYVGEYEWWAYHRFKFGILLKAEMRLVITCSLITADLYREASSVS